MTRSRTLPLLLCSFLLSARPVAAGEPALLSDLAFVPPDGLAFVHIRVADLWKSDQFKEWRDTVMKAGEKALEAFDKRFVPAPSSLERLTIFVDKVPANKKEPDPPIFIVATSRLIDRNDFAMLTVPGARKMKTAAGTILIDDRRHTEIYFIDDKTFLVGGTGSVQRFLSRPKATEGNLRSAMRLASAGKPFVAAINPQAIPQQELRQVPPPLRPLFQAKLATVVLHLGQESRLDVRLVCADADGRSQAEASIKQGLQLARPFLDKGRRELEQKIQGDGKPGSINELPEAAAAVFGLGMLNRIEAFLESPPLQPEGDTLHLTIKLPQGPAGLFAVSAMGSALLIPAVQKVREAAARTQSQNNMKQIALAMHNFHSATGKLPSAAICDAKGKPLLSWRVKILPYVEQEELYRQFKLNEPWDSEHNRKLIPQMPAIYHVPAADPATPGETFYRLFVGGGAGFEMCKGLRFPDFTDGTSNTIMCVEAAESVPWTKPDELVYGPGRPLPRFGRFYGDQIFNAAFFDGSVRVLRSDLAENILRAYITRAGGEVIPAHN